MRTPSRYLSPSEAAGRLGISVKALRLYEERGLIEPGRNAAGWRVYGPDEMERGARIVVLRGLGLRLAEMARILDGDAGELTPALARHQVEIDRKMRELAETARRIGEMRAELGRDHATIAGGLQSAAEDTATHAVAFDLPWPWDGERFELGDLCPLAYIVGPLGSGKTRFAMRLAETLADTAFVGLDRLEEGAADAKRRVAQNPELQAGVEVALAWLVSDGATVSDALLALLAAIQAEQPTHLVVDMVEQGLDAATQEALIAFLRHQTRAGRSMFLMTRSSAILDLEAVGPGEAILFCPANHAPPQRVLPFPGTPGYEAVATCLAPPSVRARTEGMTAWRPQVVAKDGGLVR